MSLRESKLAAKLLTSNSQDPACSAFAGSVSADVVTSVCAKLSRMYGEPRLGNPEDPVDDLVFIILSNKTSPKIACDLFSTLKEKYKTWDEVLNTSLDELAQILRAGGFARLRSEAIHGSLSKLYADWGECNLRALANRNANEMLQYLTALPGVSNKVARCVMLYTLGFEVLPVDSHVFRVAKRLGWTNKNRADLAHAQLESVVPAPQLHIRMNLATCSH